MTQADKGPSGRQTANSAAEQDRDGDLAVTVVPRREADRLQLQVVLVRPEPRHGVIGYVRASHDLGHDIRLVVRVLNRFEPDGGTARVAVGVQRTIPYREDVRQAGAALPVHSDAVPSHGTHLEERSDRRLDADAYDRHVARQYLAAPEPHSGDPARPFLEALDRGAQTNVDAMGAVFRLVETRERLAGDPGQHAIERLEL